jgi:hypothetical protein
VTDIAMLLKRPLEELIDPEKKIAGTTHVPIVPNSSSRLPVISRIIIAASESGPSGYLPQGTQASPTQETSDSQVLDIVQLQFNRLQQDILAKLEEQATNTGKASSTTEARERRLSIRHSESVARDHRLLLLNRRLVSTLLRAISTRSKIIKNAICLYIICRLPVLIAVASHGMTFHSSTLLSLPTVLDALIDVTMGGVWVVQNDRMASSGCLLRESLEKRRQWRIKDVTARRT